MSTTSRILLSAILVASVVTEAEIYKTVDKNGQVTYSDKPSKNAEKIDIGPINTTPAESQYKAKQKQEPNVSQPSDEKQQDNQARYSQLTITSPTTDTVIPNGLNGLTVSVSSTPALVSGHQYKLFINGTPRGLSATPNFSLERIGRGSHSLQVKIVDNNGKSLKQSSTVDIFARWPGN